MMKQYIISCIALLLMAATPAIAARTVLPLDDGWRFFFKHENSSDNARFVTLPHTWSSAANECLQTAAIYQNELFVPVEWATKRLFLKFYGVQNVADLFVNGHHVGEHRGGATAFTFEITNKVRFGSDNSLRVDVSNMWQNDVLPTSTEQNLYGGIYRGVELIVTDKTAISPLYYGSDGVLIHPKTVTENHVAGEVEIHLTATTPGTACTVTLEITTPDGYQAFIRSQKARADGKAVVVPFSFEDPMLWSPASPSLYTVTAYVESDYLKDVVTVRTGFRDIRVTPEGGFQLNGCRLNIRGVAVGHDTAAAGGALTPADYDTDIALVRELGANAVRSAGMPHAPSFYERCDREGLLAWVDLPLQRAPYLSDIAYFSAPRFEQNGLQQLREIIAQNINHPSVAMWGIFSCLWSRGDDAQPYIRTLNETAHTMDPSRPTVACSNQDGGINLITDLIVWQQNIGWEKGTPDDVKRWSELLRKNWSRLRSGVAYGAEGVPGLNSYEAQPSNRPNWLPESRQTEFHEIYAKHLNSDSLFWGVWIHNLSDIGTTRRPYGINASGLTTRDRRIKKEAFHLYKTLWNAGDSTIYLTGQRTPLRPDGACQFKIYARQRPTLYIGCDTVPVREWAPCQYRSDTVVLTGRYKVKAVAGTQADSCEIIAGSALKQRSTPALLRTEGLPPTN